MIYSILQEPELTAPVMVSALAGWVDAALVGTATADRLARDGPAIVRFDPDALFDYRSQRPILDIVDGEMTQAVWPEVVVKHSSLGGRDVLVLTGQEPDLSWRRFSAAVAELALRLRVVQFVTVGAVPAAVPHTIAPPILTTASDKALLKGEERPPEGLLRVPAAAVSIVDQEVAGSGIPTVGFFCQVPHYVPSPYPAGVLALMRRLVSHLSLDLSTAEIEEEAAQHRVQLDAIIAGRPEAQEHVQRLEAMSAERLVSGEELASEIERYLRNAPPGAEGGDEP